MILWTKTDLLEALQTQIVGHNLKSDLAIEEIAIDSRKDLKNKLFLAIKGENTDGHLFLNQAFENSAQVAIIQDAELFKKTSQNLILVKNSFAAFYKLAEYSRKKTDAKIIAITGSVGKTGVKEMLKSAFANQGKTYATIGNLNNHIGVPLTLCNMPHDTQFAIIEMGMNHLREIKPLSDLARPHIAAITTIAPAHIGNFNNEEEIALAKSEIFSGLEPKGFAIINHDNKYYDFLRKKALECKIEEKNILSFGKNIESNYCLKNIEIKSFEQSFATIKIKNNAETSYEISTANQTTIFNSLIVFACLDLLVANKINGLKSLKTISAPKGRGAILNLNVQNKNIIIIDDSYNANVASMHSGLQYLSELKKILNKKRSIAVLGDMFELGTKSEESHVETLKLLQNLKIDLTLLAGEEMIKAAKILEKTEYKTFANSSDLAVEIKNFLQDGDILFVKGSRGMKMENAIEILK